MKQKTRKRFLAGVLSTVLLCTSAPVHLWASGSVSEDTDGNNGMAAEQQNSAEGIVSRDDDLAGSVDGYEREGQSDVQADESAGNGAEAENLQSMEEGSVNSGQKMEETEEDNARIENRSSEDASGKCGENAEWFYDSVTGILTISGEGEMDYYYNSPWRSIDFVSVKIANGITNIVEYAFSGCSSLANVTIPKSVTSIGRDAFSGCSSLTSVTIPEGVKIIWDQAFSGCSSLTSVTIPEGVKIIWDQAFLGCSSLTSVTIPEGVTSIGDQAFSGCSSLTSVTIPEGVTSIEIWTFSECSNLTSVTIPESVTSIGRDAFYGCSSLTSVTIPEGVTSIGNQAFYGCSSLTSVTIPEGVTSIEGAFYGCSSLRSVTIPGSVTSIEGAFGGCSSLGSVTIPKGVTNIGEYTFSGCSSLGSVTIPKGVTSIGKYAFSGCSSLTSMTIPEGVTSIGRDAFSGCSSLTSVTIPKGVTSIEVWTFSECSNLASVTIPESVKSIKNQAFFGCSDLESVTIPGNVTNIDWLAFLGCSNLKKVYFEGSFVAAISFDSYVIAYYPSGNETWTEEARKKFSRVQAWKKWIPDGNKTTTSIAGKEEHYLSGAQKFETEKNATETINGDKVIKGTTWKVDGNTTMEGSLILDSNAEVTINGTLTVDELVVEKNAVLNINHPGKVYAKKVTARGGWGIIDNGGKIQLKQGLLSTDYLTLEGRSTLSVISGGKIVVKDTMAMSTNAKSSEFAVGTLFIRKNLILNGHKKNFISEYGENFQTVFYGKENHTFSASDSSYNLGALYVTDKSIFSSLGISSKNYVKAATCTVNESEWYFTEKDAISDSGTDRDYGENVESAFAGIAAQSAFTSNNSQLSAEENRFVDTLAAVWINTLNTPLCEGFTESQNADQELHFELNNKFCILKCRGVRFSFGGVASVYLNVNGSQNDSLVGAVSNANVKTFSDNAKKYLSETMKSEFISYASGQAAGFLSKNLGLGKITESVIKKFIEKIAKKVCVNQKILKTNKSNEVKDFQNKFKLVKILEKASSSARVMGYIPENRAIRGDDQEEQVLLEVSDTVTDPWLREELIAVLGANADGEPDFSKALNVTTLDLSDGYIRDLNGLQYFTNLKELDVSNNELQDLSPLAGLTSLKSLDISGQFISNLYPIASLTQLTTLNAESNELTTLSSIASLINLQNLDVSGNQVRTLSSLSGLTNLRNLCAANNPLEDRNLASLNGLENLEILDLEDCCIYRLDGINVQSLEEIYLANNKVGNLQPISAASSLKILDVSNNGAFDVEELAGDTALEKLILNDNELKNLNGLGALDSLTVLNLSQTYLTETDLDVLDSMQDLTDLDISDNPVFGLSCLAKLSKLSKITVKNTALSALDVSTLKESGKTVIGFGNTINAQKLYFLDSEINLEKGKTYWQNPLCYPSGANLENLSWESSNPVIAEVNNRGIVTAKTIGKATIKVFMNDGSPTAFYTVDVEVAENPSDVPTQTETPTITPEEILTETPTETSTVTPTDTPITVLTGIPTATPTEMPTAIPTNKPPVTNTGISSTNTGMITATPTNTPSATPINTPTAVPTDTPSETPIVTFVENPDGSRTETTVSTEKGEEGSIIQTIEVVHKDTDGNITSSSMKSVISTGSQDNGVSIIVNVEKDGKGIVTAATAEISGTTSTGNSKALFSGSMVRRIMQIANTKDIEISVDGKDGFNGYKVIANAADLTAGKKLGIVIRKPNGAYVLVNAKTYTVTEDGDVFATITGNRTYELVNSSKMNQLSNKILKTIEVKKPSKTLKKSKATSIALKKKLDMDNVKSIKYTVSKKSVAKVTKKGIIKAKKPGTATVRAKVTLKNGKTKTVKMKIKVKK